MTRQEAKKLALSKCKKFPEITFSVLETVHLQMQAEYARRSYQIILDTLHDIMRRTPGAVLTRVHDTFIIETTSEPQAEKIALDLRITQHGVTIQTSPAPPLGSPV